MEAVYILTSCIFLIYSTDLAFIQLILLCVCAVIYKNNYFLNIIFLLTYLDNLLITGRYNWVIVLNFDISFDIDRLLIINSIGRFNAF